MDVFLRRRQSGRKLIVWLWNKLTILAVRTVGRLTGAARDVAAHFAVTGWWNWPDQGNHLEAGHRVHEPDEHWALQTWQVVECCVVAVISLIPTTNAIGDVRGQNRRLHGVFRKTTCARSPVEPLKSP